MSYQLTKHKYLLGPELNLLRQQLNTSGGRDKILIDLLLSTGGRAQEILNLRGCDLNDAAESVHIQGLKGSNDREIPLPSALYKELAKLRGPDLRAPVFNLSYARLYQIWDYWRPVKKTIHSLRHTFAIELYKKCKDLRLVQVALGHKSIHNTMIYSNYLYSQEELRKQLVG